MEQSNNIPKSVKINFYLNLLNFVPFIVLIITGLTLQIEYHMHHLPDDYSVSGLNRSGWLNIHKAAAVISLAGILIHCLLHWKFIAMTVKKIFNQKSRSRIVSSFYLLIIFIPSFLTALCSWIFFDHGNNARITLVEIHDKMTLLLIVFFIVHIISRFGWMTKTYKKINNADAG